MKSVDVVEAGITSASRRDGAAPVIGAPAGVPHTEVDRQIRGSSLLLFGRLLSMAANLVVQVLIVRALSRTDFGIFAYALSIVTVLTTVVTLGMDRGLARFVVLYEERGDVARLWGVVGLQLMTILGLGAAAAAVAIGGRSFVAGTLVDDARLAQLLAVMIILAPVQALDSTAASLFAAFGRSKAIFVRRYLLGPVLRLAAVAGVLVFGGGVFALGAGYLAVGVVGLAVYGTLLTRAFRERGLVSADGARTRLDLPLKEVAVFTMPLLLSDAMFVVLNTSDVVILARVAGADAVAGYRAVLPLAHLNQLVMNSFALLFAPLMARLWGRGDRKGLTEAYWRTATWVAVLTFPLAAVTVGLAEPLTRLLFGARYEGSATFLQILAASAYFNASLGFNGVTVKMVGRVWLVAAAAGAALVANLALNLALIPRYGAIGAAWGTASTVALYNILKHLALRRATGADLLTRRYRGVYLIILGAFAVVVAGAVVGLPTLPSAVVAAGASAAVLLGGRRELAVDAMFPELLRIPLLGRFVAGADKAER